MKRLVSCGIAFIALAVSGWSNASTLDIPVLCGGFDILNDPENRVYRGEFKSKGVTLETALVVTPVTSSGSTVVFYVWGEQPKWKITEAGCTPAAASQKGDTMRFYMGGTKIWVTYKFSGDEASVKYKRSGSTTKGKVTLSEMTVPTSTTAATRQAEETSSATVTGKRRITTEQEYRDAVVGKKFGNKHGYFVVHEDGTFTGKFDSKKMTGEWTWEGEFFCRSGKLGTRKIKRDCQAIFLEGDAMTGHRKKGKGKKVTYRLQESDS